MILLRLDLADCDTLLTALRFLQENVERIPRDLVDLCDRGPPDERQIDDLCARLAAAAHPHRD